MDKLKSVWKSRRVWVAIAGVAVACANSLGVEVDAVPDSNSISVKVLFDIKGLEAPTQSFAFILEPTR